MNVICNVHHIFQLQISLYLAVSSEFAKPAESLPWDKLEKTSWKSVYLSNLNMFEKCEEFCQGNVCYVFDQVYELEFFCKLSMHIATFNFNLILTRRLLLIARCAQVRVYEFVCIYRNACTRVVIIRLTLLI
jgi:hypothetical protein